MIKRILLILLCLPMIGFGQNVNIPDANFKAYLVGEPLINTNGDTEIQVSEANAYSGYIFCNSLNISNLIGMEAFTALTSLYCENNQLTSLDVSQNLALTDLLCANNLLTSLVLGNNTALGHLNCIDNNLINLDLSQNTALYRLACDNNQLTSLDVSSNTILTALLCYDNQLTSLDLSQNTILTDLICNNNQLTSLDLRNGNNNLLDTNFFCLNNPNLSCIDVDDVSWSTANWTNIDLQHYFSNNCPPPSAIQEHTTNKELLKVTDLLGRETKGKKNEPLFYIYDDGTVEKRIVIE